MAEVMMNLRQPTTRSHHHGHNILLWESVQNFAAFFIFFWLVAVLLHHIFCRKFQWYHNQVISGSIHVSFGRIYLTCDIFNSAIQRIGSWPRLVKLWRMYFICGVVVSSLLIIPVFFFLIYLFMGHAFRLMRMYKTVASRDALDGVHVGLSPLLTNISLPPTVSPASGSGSGSVSLVPVVPGINLPLGNIVPFFISVLFSTFFHELGHGIAAASEFTDVGGVGVALIGVFPAAFVVIKNMDTQAVARQLRIMAAGVWHNIILALLAALLLWNLPVILKGFYPQGHGVSVLAILTESRAHSNETAAFRPGMEIYGVNNCSVGNVKSLERCTLNYTKPGFCLSLQQMKSARDHFIPPVLSGPEKILECCRNVSSALCFRDDSVLSSAECLFVGKVIMQAGKRHQRCNSSLDCSSPDSTCYIPYLSSEERLLIFNTSTGPLLFVGDSFSLLRNLRLSNYARRWVYLPSSFPDILEMTLKYLLSISAALALLNLVPSFGLDGSRFAALWLDLLFRYNFLPNGFSRFQARIINSLTVISSFFLVADILLGFTQIVIHQRKRLVGFLFFVVLDVYLVFFEDVLKSVQSFFWPLKLFSGQYISKMKTHRW